MLSKYCMNLVCWYTCRCLCRTCQVNWGYVFLTNLLSIGNNSREHFLRIATVLSAFCCIKFVCWYKCNCLWRTSHFPWIATTFSAYFCCIQFVCWYKCNCICRTRVLWAYVLSINIVLFPRTFSLKIEQLLAVLFFCIEFGCWYKHVCLWRTSQVNWG